MKITKASDAVGAFIDEVDVTLLSDDQFAKIRRAFLDHGVLFFYDQYISPEEHIEFAERWGNITINRYFTPVEGYPQIGQILKEPDQKTNIGGGWHTDHSYDQIPAMGSILYALDLPQTGGDTIFAGMHAAYEALDDDLKAQIAGLKAIHGNAHIFGAKAEHRHAIGDRFITTETANQQAIHPIALKHPETGKIGIFVNPAFTTGIVDMGQDQADELLQKLYDHCKKPEFQYRFRWQPGALAMWDNRSTWHYAMNDYHGQRRYLNRITIEGVALQ